MRAAGGDTHAAAHDHLPGPAGGHQHVDLKLGLTLHHLGQRAATQLDTGEALTVTRVFWKPDPTYKILKDPTAVCC